MPHIVFCVWMGWGTKFEVPPLVKRSHILRRLSRSVWICCRLVRAPAPGRLVDSGLKEETRFLGRMS